MNLSLCRTSAIVLWDSIKVKKRTVHFEKFKQYNQTIISVNWIVLLKFLGRSDMISEMTFLLNLANARKIIEKDHVKKQEEKLSSIS